MFSLFRTHAQVLKHVHPLNWYVGMKNTKLQLLLHGDKIAEKEVIIKDTSIILEGIHKVENSNYLFLDLDLKNAKAGIFDIEIFQKGKKKPTIHHYELKERNSQNGKTRVQGVTAADLVYLIMPDRFSDGDSSTNIVKGMRDVVCDRNNIYARHGGDLKGIQNHLDYFSELGITALWLNPVIENDNPLTEEGGVMRSTYHGYAFTDHYQVDRRFGGNTAYAELIEAMHAKGLKIIQDAVYNHTGLAHWFIEDLPMKDWLNQWSGFQQTSYKDQPLIDLYASQYDFDISQKGWFTHAMPDLNQSNPFVSTYLIQHAIWTTEYFGIDGWRVDTYFYSEEHFLNRINDALLNEFPSLTLFGETWLHSSLNCAYFCKNNLKNLRFNHNLQGVTDFPLYFAINNSLNQNFGWTEGVNRLYTILQEDIVYQDPYRNSIFLDNHDLDRFFSVIGEDLNKFKMGITWLLTLRGIPQLYYGTEILMKNFKDPSDAMVRLDFPGGWPKDKVNKFNTAGRTIEENEAFNFVKSLANYRKNNPVLANGKLMQFTPFDDGVYVYFRYNDTKTIMVVSNTSKKTVSVNCSRFKERTQNFTKAFEVLTQVEYSQIETLELEAMQVLVLELR